MNLCYTVFIKHRESTMDSFIGAASSDVDQSFGPEDVGMMAASYDRLMNGVSWFEDATDDEIMANLRNNYPEKFEENWY